MRWTSGIVRQRYPQAQAAKTVASVATAARNRVVTTAFLAKALATNTVISKGAAHHLSFCANPSLPRPKAPFLSSPPHLHL